MKRILSLVLLVFVSVSLTACTRPEVDPPERTITSNITDGHTITQVIGADQIDVSGITFTDSDGTDLTSMMEISGGYLLDTIGVYELTLSVTDTDGTSHRVTVYLEIVQDPCTLNPELEECQVAVTGIELSSSSQAIDTIIVGDFIIVNWTLSPENASNQTVLIETSDEAIATVSQYGYVFGQSEGTVTITFTTEDGSFSTTKTYTVREATCEENPLQDKCIHVFLTDDSRVTTFSDPNQSGTDYSILYPNNRIYYEIFVRTFADSDGDLDGDFEGLIDTIPYLQMLNVGGVWLMPINETTSDHGYDISDYYDVNPEYGTMAEFESYLDAADAAGIDVIMDLVVNHMGAHNDIFQDVLQKGTTSEYYDWFTWIDASSPRADDKGSWGQDIWYNPTNRSWLRKTSFTVHSSIQNQLFFGYFSDWMPDLNLENPDVVDYIYDVATFWLNKGVHGFRMDATSHLYALNEHPDISNRNQKNIDFLTGFRNHVVSIHPTSYIVIEAWESYDVYIPYAASGVSPFNFQGSYWIKDAANGYLNNEVGDALSFLYDEIRDYNVGFIDSLFLSNHDMDRVSVVVNDPDKLRQAAEILLTTKSNPFIYFGDEIGIKGTRTNMVWGDYYDSLFTEFADRDVDSVSEQLLNPDSLLSKYIELGEVRSNSLALSYGDFLPYNTTHLEGYYRSFDNGNDEELVVVLFNFTSGTTVPIPSEFSSYEILYSSYDDNIGGISPRGTVILRLPYELRDTLYN